MDGTSFVVDLPDGRRLDGWASDPGVTNAVLLELGTPCAGIPYGPFVQAVVDRGCRFVTYSRPGYGASTRRAGRSVADCTIDVAAIASELGLEQIHALGWSGGGPHALAGAARLPSLVASAATIAGVAPATAAGLDWLDGMAEENKEELGAAFDGPDALEAFLRKAGVGLREQRGENVAEALGGLVTDVDKRALSGPLADYLATMTHAALEKGIWGWHDDDLAFARDWGFALDEIDVPVTVWQGRQDAMVPFAHGEWLAAHIPGARAELFEDEGHISLVLHFAHIVDDLID